MPLPAPTEGHQWALILPFLPPTGAVQPHRPAYSGTGGPGVSHPTEGTKQQLWEFHLRPDAKRDTVTQGWRAVGDTRIPRLQPEAPTQESLSEPQMSTWTEVVATTGNPEGSLRPTGVGNSNKDMLSQVQPRISAQKFLFSLILLNRIINTICNSSPPRFWCCLRQILCQF